jgi:hypothetical protein
MNALLKFYYEINSCTIVNKIMKNINFILLSLNLDSVVFSICILSLNTLDMVNVGSSESKECCM